MSKKCILNSIGLIGIDNFRTRAYVQLLHNNSIIISKIILIGKNNKKKIERMDQNLLFDHEKSILTTYSNEKSNIIETNAKTINSKKIRNLLIKSKQKYFIFSGIPGEKVSSEILNTGKKFIHIHPGILPDFKGSTTHYYYLFKKRKIGLTAFILNKNFDSGKIISKKEFKLPQDLNGLDHILDPYFRALMLLQIIKKFIKTKKIKTRPNKRNNSFYYIIHPVLKQISVLKK